MPGFKCPRFVEYRCAGAALPMVSFSTAAAAAPGRGAPAPRKLQSCVRKQSKYSSNRPLAAAAEPARRVSINPEPPCFLVFSPTASRDLFFEDPNVAAAAMEAALNDIEPLQASRRGNVLRPVGPAPPARPHSGVASAGTTTGSRGVGFRGTLGTGVPSSSVPTVGVFSRAPRVHLAAAAPETLRPARPVDAEQLGPPEGGPKQARLVEEIENMSINELKDKIREVTSKRRNRQRRLHVPQATLQYHRAPAPAPARPVAEERWDLDSP